MRLVILASALVLSAGAPAGPPIGKAGYLEPARNCPPISRFHAIRQGKSVKPQKLTELPPADHYKAAYRTVGGCETPIIARFDPGSGQSR